MGVEMPQYSEKKRKMYEAAEQYYSAIKQGKTQEDIEKKWKVKDASSK